MTSKIQKYNGENKTQGTSKDATTYYSNKFVWALIVGEIILGLGVFSANGLLGNVLTIIITFIIVSLGIFFGVYKHREKLTKQQQGISISIGIIFFAVLSISLFNNTYHSVEPPSIALKPELEKLVSPDTTKRKNEKPEIQSNKDLQPSKTKITNITSINQKGGQIAETINNNIIMTPPQRKLQTDSVFAELYSNRNFSFTLHFEADDKESRVFAENISECLLKASWKMIGSVAHSMDFSSKNVTIETGTSPACDKASKALLNVLLKNKIVVKIVKDVKLKEDFMYLRIYPIE